MQNKNKSSKTFFHCITSSKCGHQRNLRMVLAALWIGFWGVWIEYGATEVFQTIRDGIKPAEAKEIMVIKKIREEKKPEKVYAYNERVPVPIVKDEIVKISRRFTVDENLMLRIAKCESGYNNLAANPRSSALGVYQFLNNTWKNTDTWRLYHKAPTDYKVNVWEAVAAVARGELWRWNASRGCWK